MKERERSNKKANTIIISISTIFVFTIIVLLRINMIQVKIKATTDLCLANMKYIANALDHYHANTGFYPNDNIDRDSTVYQILIDSGYLNIKDISCPLNENGIYEYHSLEESDFFSIICNEKHWYDETFFGKKKYYKAPIKYVEGKGIVTDPPLL